MGVRGMAHVIVRVRGISQRGARFSTQPLLGRGHLDCYLPVREPLVFPRPQYRRNTGHGSTGGARGAVRLRRACDGAHHRAHRDVDSRRDQRYDMVLIGSRLYFAMAQDGIFFESFGKLNGARVPMIALAAQGVWAACLTLAAHRGWGIESNDHDCHRQVREIF